MKLDLKHWIFNVNHDLWLYDLIFQDLDAPDVYETEDLPEDDQALQTTSEVKASIILDIVTFTKNIILNIVTFTTKY